MKNAAGNPKIFANFFPCCKYHVLMQYVSNNAPNAVHVYVKGKEALS